MDAVMEIVVEIVAEMIGLFVDIFKDKCRKRRGSKRKKATITKMAIDGENHE